MVFFGIIYFMYSITYTMHDIAYWGMVPALSSDADTRNQYTSRATLFAGIGGRFDLIVSNPPYIARDVIPTLDPEVSEMEPHIALDGGADGLDFEKKIAFEAREYLNPGGWLFLEIGFDQGEAVASYLAENGYQEVRTDRDLGGRDRVVSGRWSGKG